MGRILIADDHDALRRGLVRGLTEAGHEVEEASNGNAAIERLTDSYFRSEEHTSELQSRVDLVCRLLLEKKKRHTWRWPLPWTPWRASGCGTACSPHPGWKRVRGSDDFPAVCPLPVTQTWDPAASRRVT